MSQNDLVLLLPLIVIAGAAIVLMLTIGFYRHHTLAFILTLAGLAGAIATLPLVFAGQTSQADQLVAVDTFALFYMGLLFTASFVVALLAYGYLERYAGVREEFYLLLLLATLGAAVLVTSNHFATFFLGLEILSVSLYPLIAYMRTAQNTEAGLKYLILAGVSSAFLLFGMALIYADTGTMSFGQLAAQADGSLLILVGLAMTIIGIGFKLAVVPFHLWTPDVYEGAPVPVTAFIATVSKGAMVALLLRYFNAVDGYSYGSMVLVFTLIAIASMLAGSLLALLQNNVKRILAYSSIAHLGYVLVAFLAGGTMAMTAVTYYLVAYFVTTLSAFGVVTALSDPEQEADELAAYRCLFWRRPWLAGLFTAALLSLAGIPLTAGFIGKFYVVAAGVEAARWLLVFILVLSSAIGVFYYLRIIVAIYTPPAPEEKIPLALPSLSLAGSVGLAGLTLLLIWLGVYPAPLIRVIQAMVANLS